MAAKVRIMRRKSTITSGYIHIKSGLFTISGSRNDRLSWFSSNATNINEWWTNW